MSSLLRKLNITISLVGIIGFSGITSTLLFAAQTSNFTQTINAGTLSIDIVDGSYVTVGSPSVTMSAKTFSFTCLTGGSASTGTFGTTTQRIYIKNPDGADNGWTASLAASAPTAVWDGAVSDYDFNDPTSS
jgi:flagellin-like hook-associated protein FlgL